uniref:Uncharacterized protein n=1 Tax=Kryptolebias marmoratus TaxID=37003 RepID=A0A3Q3AR58_KRYMA
DERDAVEESESPSILPSSVLSKASDIAQHFNSIKRGSLVQDDARSLGCPSPRLPSRTGSSLSLSTKAADRPLRSLSSEPAEAFSDAGLTLPSPRDDSIFDPDRSIRRRRDSTLSKQDQLLIGKIKTYYENAGNQDATFSIRRRESLTYIPTGLVRSSVSRLNSVPKDKHVLRNPSRSQSLHDNLFDDEEFRPSSEMIKVWQAMERQITKSQGDDTELNQSRDALKASIAASVYTPTKTLTKSFDPESGASDLSTITEDSTSPSPPKTKASGFSRAGGKSSLTLPLVSDQQAASLPLSPADRSAAAAAPPGRSPLSPPPSIEGFSWPDVRELRSRYSNSGRSQKNLVSRSRSIPEKMFESGQRSKRLQRDEAGHDGYYIAAEAPLSDDPERTLIVMEKLPAPKKTAEEPKEEDAKARTEPGKTAAASAEQETSRKTETEGSQGSIVKNLREKFQSQS